MPKIKYQDLSLKGPKLDKIEKANVIIAQYQAQGFSLTLRQLYYQFVSRGLIPNNDREYKALGEAISDGRMAGLIDWRAIVDRTRNLLGNSHWSRPSQIIESAASGYAIDKWAGQEFRVEVWVEKDALIGVIETICRQEDVSYFACRGYTSQSEMWAAAMRLRNYQSAGQKPYVLHLGDHDPSGIDMTRDVRERLELFGVNLSLDRLALNFDQVEAYNPPPNPAKLSDSRADGYIATYGASSWELDALEPSVIAELIRTAVRNLRDVATWNERVALEQEGRDLLDATSNNWDTLVPVIQGYLE